MRATFTLTAASTQPQLPSSNRMATYAETDKQIIEYMSAGYRSPDPCFTSPWCYNAAKK
jgi:hypothetical protein